MAVSVRARQLVAGACAGGFIAWYTQPYWRPWRTVDRRVVGAGGGVVVARIREQWQPPPIGCVLWPAGRALLHWALASEHIGPDAVVLEMGSGCGLTAIGLALASAPGRVSRVVATDACDASLRNLSHNVAANGCADRVSVERWDIGEGALPPSAADATHVLGADVVYHGAAGEQLVGALARLLHERPRLHIFVLLVDRFSGAGFAGVRAAAGMPDVSVVPAHQLDPEIERFEQSAAAAGLELRHELITERMVGDAAASQSAWERVQWWFVGHWDGMRLYRVLLAGAEDGADGPGRRPSSS